MTRQKKKILVFIDWYLPGFRAGGPIKSCVSLVERMKEYFDFSIVTGNTDLNETTPYPGVNSDNWNILSDGTRVFYFSKAFLTRKNIEKLIRSENPDILYLNSMFSLYFTLVPLWLSKSSLPGIRVIVAPRGMLSPGALALKPLKKAVFLSLARSMGLFNHVTFHASTQVEMGEVRKVFGKNVNVLHAINLTPKTIPERVVRTKSAGTASLVYVGRISEVKNLWQCLKALSETNPEHSFTFDVYGPVDDSAYLQRCSDEMRMLPAHVTATLHGPVANSEIGTLLTKYQFLFLLSMNENYGHAIVEAFTAGCPVIIGNRTPWRNLESKKRGWDLPLEDQSGIVNALNVAARMDQATYDAWSDSARLFAKEIHENKKAIDDHLALFNS